MVYHLSVSNKITWAGIKTSLKFIAPFVRYVKRIKGWTAEKVPPHQILDSTPFNWQTKKQPDSRSNSSSNTVSNIHSQELNLTFTKLKLNNFKVIVALKSTKIFTLRSKVTAFRRVLIPILNSGLIPPRSIHEKMEVSYHGWRNQKHRILPAAMFHSVFSSNALFAFQQRSC